METAKLPNRVPCVTAILYNSEGQVLLYQRDNKPNLSYPGHWSTLGGVVETGETPQEAIRRELMEEIELEMPLRLWKVFERLRSSDIIINQYVFVGQLERPVTEIVLNEGQALAYFKETEVATLPIGFGFKEILEEFFETKGIEEELHAAYPNPCHL